MATLKIPGAGDLLREIREGQKVSLKELARRLGWDQGRVSKYETGRLAVSLPVLEEISQALGLRPEMVLLRIIKSRYPRLSKKGSEMGSLLDKLIGEMARVQT